MTKDDTIRMAREAAAVHGHTLKAEPSIELVETLEAFYSLAVVAEREACAKVCEDYGTHNITVDCAAAIRARSQS